jgi:transcriptional regulator with XRE-family HTH domain
MTLGTYLKALRVELGLSLREVADRTGGVVSHAYLGQVERGVDRRTGKAIHPSVEKLRAVATVYGVPVWDVLRAAGYVEDSGRVETALDHVRRQLAARRGLDALHDLTLEERARVAAYVRASRELGPDFVRDVETLMELRYHQRGLPARGDRGAKTPASNWEPSKR